VQFTVMVHSHSIFACIRQRTCRLQYLFIHNVTVRKQSKSQFSEDSATHSKTSVARFILWSLYPQQDPTGAWVHPTHSTRW
jgi:hypothetical protein